MFLDMNGEEVTLKLDLLKDILNINFQVDVNDIPFSKYGITTNFSKNTYSDTISFISDEVKRIISINEIDNSVKFEKVTYNESNKIFTIHLSILGSDYDINLKGE